MLTDLDFVKKKSLLPYLNHAFEVKQIRAYPYDQCYQCSLTILCPLTTPTNQNSEIKRTNRTSLLPLPPPPFSSYGMNFFDGSG